LLRVTFGGSLAGKVSSSCRFSSLSSSRLSRCSRVSLYFGTARPPCCVTLPRCCDLAPETHDRGSRRSAVAVMCPEAPPYRLRRVPFELSEHRTERLKAPRHSLISRPARSNMAPWRKQQRRGLRAYSAERSTRTAPRTSNHSLSSLYRHVGSPRHLGFERNYSGSFTYSTWLRVSRSYSLMSIAAPFEVLPARPRWKH
jgi:hypothetical protein